MTRCHPRRERKRGNTRARLDTNGSRPHTDQPFSALIQSVSHAGIGAKPMRLDQLIEELRHALEYGANGCPGK